LLRRSDQRGRSRRSRRRSAYASSRIAAILLFKGRIKPYTKRDYLPAQIFVEPCDSSRQNTKVSYAVTTRHRTARRSEPRATSSRTSTKPTLPRHKPQQPDNQRA